MTNNQYLNKILESQTLASGSSELKDLQEHRQEVEELLLKHFEKSNPTIRYGGSVAKGTLIKEAYDLDIVCYFEHGDTSAGDTLKDIFENAEAALQSQYLVERKTSALRLKSKAVDQYGLDFHIDVVPGRYTDEGKSDTYIYQSSADKCRLKTNIETHIAHIKGSGVVDAIRLMKLWRERNGLQIKTFALELMTVELLKSKKTESLTTQMGYVWTELRDNIDAASIEDPANPTGNDLSGLMNASVKYSLNLVASSTLNLIENRGWEAVFGPIEEGDEEKRLHSLRQATVSVITPSKPWLDRK
jgi:Second Messenger Oligonucleotide or Dinucleotide Synthetase domain